MTAARRPARLTTGQAELYAACVGLATNGRTPYDVLAGYASGVYAQPAADLVAVRAALDLTAGCPAAADCPYPDCQVADPPPGCPAVVNTPATRTLPTRDGVALGRFYAAQPGQLAACAGCQCCPAHACDPGEPLGPGICGPDCPCHPDHPDDPDA